MNTINCAKQSLYTPDTYHRRYDLDLPTQQDEPGWENQAKRIAQAALPYISLYQPAGSILSIGMGSWRAVSHLSGALTSDGDWKNISIELFQTSLAVLSVATSIFNFSTGLFLSTAIETLQGLYNLCHSLYQGEYRRSLDEVLQTVGSAAYLGFMLSGALEIMVGFALLQAAINLSQAQQEFAQGRYLEAAAKIGMGFIRLHQARGYVQQIELRNQLFDTPKIERRAAVDVGSGSTKICIVEIDVATNQITKVLHEESFPVPYQTYLEVDPEGLFNGEIQEKGLAAFTKIQELLQKYEVNQVAAVATEAFRKSHNGEDFAQTVATKTGIPLKVISQEEEGKIAFYSALSASHSNAEDLLIWDIGTGSFQIIADDEIDHELDVYMQSMGSVPFKNYIIHDIQGFDPSLVKSPNPITEEDWKMADALARKMGRNALDSIKQKVKNLEGNVVGIGRLFANSIKPIGNDGRITRKDLRAFIRNALNKTDIELGDPFANVNSSNAMLVLGVMKALHMHEINIIETTSTKGIVSYKPYWDKAIA